MTIASDHPARRLLLLAGLLLIGAAAPAAATVHSVSLSLDLGTATSASFDFPPDQITQTYVTLTGFTPFTVTSGDTVNFDVSFTGSLNGGPDGVYSVSPSVAGPFGQTFLLLFQRADGGQPANPYTTALAPLVLGGASGDLGGLALQADCQTCLAARAGRANGGAYGGLSFTGLSGSLGFALDGEYTIDKVTLLAQVQSANNLGGVPEPASWALLIAGFGLVGTMQRRRQAAAAV